MWFFWVPVIILAVAFLGILIYGSILQAQDRNSIERDITRIFAPKFRALIADDVARMKRSASFHSLVNKLLPILDQYVADAKGYGKELVGEEYAYFVIMIRSTSLSTYATIRKGMPPLPGSDKYTRKAMDYFLDCSGPWKGFAYTECGFDALSEASRYVFLVALKEELERQRPHIPFQQIFHEEYSPETHVLVEPASVLTFSASQFHKKRSFRVL